MFSDNRAQALEEHPSGHGRSCSQRKRGTSSGALGFREGLLPAKPLPVSEPPPPISCICGPSACTSPSQESVRSVETSR